jgi:hypothetical protein
MIQVLPKKAETMRLKLQHVFRLVKRGDFI